VFIYGVVYDEHAYVDVADVVFTRSMIEPRLTTVSAQNSGTDDNTNLSCFTISSGGDKSRITGER